MRVKKKLKFLIDNLGQVLTYFGTKSDFSEKLFNYSMFKSSKQNHLNIELFEPLKLVLKSLFSYESQIQEAIEIRRLKTVNNKAQTANC
jgi:hypothetical protein